MTTTVTLRFVDRFAGGNQHLRSVAEAVLARLSAKWRETASSPLPDRYAALNAAADAELEAIKAQISVPIPCMQGCNHCCKFNEILVSKWQAVLIVREIECRDPVERRAIVDRVLNAAGRSGGGIASPCVLLSPDGGCSVYGARPVPCRGYHSLSEAACRSRLHGSGGDPPTFVSLRIVELAALDVLGSDCPPGDRAPMEMNALLRRIYSDPDKLAAWIAGRPADEPDLVEWPAGLKNPIP
jgi:hypothetical protein